MTTTATKQQTIPPPPPPAAAPASRPGVTFGAVKQGAGFRAVLYGPGGIGKTTLAAGAPGPVGFIDLDDSLPRLSKNLDDLGLLEQVKVVGGIDTWAALRAALQAPGWDGVRTIVIDSLTRAEELAVAHTLATVKHEKGTKCDRLEDYGYGKGYQHVYDVFLPLLAELDAHCRAGRHVVLVCHDCTTNVPNPMGDDWLRYEPRLQAPGSGKASVRLRVREWADAVLFIGYDVAVDREGKGRGSGTRTLYPTEMPFCMAKSRTLREVLPLGLDGAAVWAKIIQ